MLSTLNNQSVGFNPTNLISERPRDSYSFVNRLANDELFYNEFKMNPLKIFDENGFDTTKIFIPSDFQMPARELLRSRLQIIYSYEDFVSPAEMSTLPILPVIFIFIPIFAS
jgi:hypothetical protein